MDNKTSQSIAETDARLCCPNNPTYDAQETMQAQTCMTAAMSAEKPKPWVTVSHHTLLCPSHLVHANVVL